MSAAAAVESEADDFYVLLPSNVDSSGSPAKYTTRLETSINLSNYSQWEMALVEMSFNDSIKTFTGEEYFELLTNHKEMGEVTTFGQIVDYGDFFGLYRVEEKDKQYTTTWSDYRKVFQLSSIFNDNIEIISDRKTKYWFKSKPATSGHRVIKLTMSPAMAWTFGFHPIPKNSTVDKINSDINLSIEKGLLTAQTLEFGIGNWTKEVVRPLTEDRPFILPLKPHVYWYEITISKDPTHPAMKEISLLKQYVPPERLSTTQEILTTLNDGLLSHPKFARHKLKLSKQRNFDRLQLTGIGDSDKEADGNWLVLEPRLASLLGFKVNKVMIPRGKAINLKANYPPDFRRSIYSIYVYCNLCNDIVVGGKRVPLLRNVAFNSTKWGSTVSILFNSPLYIGINASVINTIDIELRDDMGELIPFTEGKTVITLHFRRRPHSHHHR